jgi:glycosyltransferase involved in cell wall biosynthesis
MIPTHEPGSAFLRATIESVLNSGLAAADRQIVIVDDASRSPEFAALAEEMLARGVEVIRFDQQAGLPGNWNRCISLARGEWVHILHQDDRVRPGFYAALYDGVKNDPTIGAAFSQVAFIDSSGREFKIGPLPPRPAGILHDWVERIFVDLSVQCPCIAVRRAVYERLGGYDATFKYCSDYDMWQRIVAEYPIWHEPGVLAEYREHGGSATYRIGLASRWHERLDCLDAGLQRLSPAIRHQVARSGRRIFLRLAYNELAPAWPGLNSGQRLAALRALAKSGRVSDHIAIWRRRRPRTIPGRAPIRDADPAQPRRPRILVVSEFFPWEPDTAIFGAHQRLKRHLEALNQVCHLDAVFLWPGDSPFPESEMEKARLRIQPSWPISGNVAVIVTEPGPSRFTFETILWMLRGAVSFFHTKPLLGTCGKLQASQMREAIRTFQPDLIFAHHLGAMAALIRSRQPLPPVILDNDDVEHVRLARMEIKEIGWWPHVRRAAWVWVARHAIRVGARRARVSLVSSEHDRAILSALVSGARVEVLQNGTRDVAVPPPAPAPTAMFVGVATYPPNAAAIRSLVAEIWPRVRKLVPTAELTIVGHGALAVAKSDPDSGISVVDFVADLSGIYRNARIALCPIRHGSGTRIKIIEAAMHARPVVSTRVGAEGLTFVPGTEILIADEPESFAEACAALLLNRDRCEQIGQAARMRAMEEYSHGRIVERLANILTEVLEEGSSARPLC